MKAIRALGDAITVGSALALYRHSIVPRARRELRSWETRAEAIPDPTLRADALSALREKGQNVEATAVFGVLAPRAHRGAALGAMTAFQVAVDYLDSLGEQPSADPLADGLALHQALGDALFAGSEAGGWYRLHPQGEDGGYLHSLVRTCRQALSSLPSRAAALPLAQRAALRCAEGQSYTHAAAKQGAAELQAWAVRQECPAGYRWWEIAAGASSSVAVHALLAAAADPRTTAEEAALIDAAYFPPIGALSVLLDDLIDFEADVASGAHNYMTYYESNLVAATHLALIGARAKAASAALPKRHRHAAILAGVAGYYLSTPAARSSYATAIRGPMIESLGLNLRLVLTALRFQR